MNFHENEIIDPYQNLFEQDDKVQAPADARVSQFPLQCLGEYNAVPPRHLSRLRKRR